VLSCENVVDIEAYRASSSEQKRAALLLELIPKGYATVLDAGCRDGFHSIRLVDYFKSVTALDLVKPSIDHERVTCVAGDLTNLAYPDRSFDVVLCSEVLEHIPALEQAVSELKRVARHAILIGVPYKQDLRICRTTCAKCGKVNPPWGHINTFDENRLATLFHPFRAAKQDLTGIDPDATNALAAWLMDLGGNPYGPYGQDEVCMHCGAHIEEAPSRSFFQKICSALSTRLMRIQTRLSKPHANWIHILFER
jgi:SAM-dependent methyltransferase